MQIGRKVVFVIATNVAGAILGYGALLVIGRTFDPAAYGSFVFATSLGGLFALATTLGLGSAHQRLVARGLPHATVMGTAARLRLLLLVAGLGGCALLAWILVALHGPVFTDATTPAVLAGALAIQVFAMPRVFLAETWIGLQRVNRPEASRIVDAALFLGLLANAGLLLRHLAGQWSPVPGVGAWWADHLGLDGPLTTEQAALLLVACALIAKLVSLLLALVWALRDGLVVGPYDRLVAKELWSFALPLALTSAIGLIVAYTDVVVLGFFWTSHEVGLYGTAQKLAVLAGLVATAASGVLLSRFAQLAATDDRALEDRTFQDAERWVLILVALAVAALAALARPGIHIAVGDHYLGGADALRLLALATLVWSLQIPITARFMGHGQTRVLVLAGIVNAVANVALNLLFVPRSAMGMGPEGAALATLLSNLLAYLVLRQRAHRDLDVPWMGGHQPRILLASGLVALGWWQAAMRWPGAMDRAWELLGWGVLGTLAYIGLLALTGAVGRDDLGLVRRITHPGELLRELRGDH